MAKWAALSTGILRLLLALALLRAALAWRLPLFASVRTTALVLLLTVSIALIAVELWTARSAFASRTTRVIGAVTLVAATCGFIATASAESEFRSARERVLNADPQRLAKLGRHIIIGYNTRADIDALMERRAIAGIFLTGAYSANKSIAAMASDIAALQAMRPRQGLPPLWVATDQEGGGVSRLSPPLPFLPTLADIIARKSDTADREHAVAHYAKQQARDLAAIGVNLNFAPVVDINYGTYDPTDRLTLINTRAIAKDPGTVTEVARTYCATMIRFHIHCTLKHFPGLGRVIGDTHLKPAELSAMPDELAATDWLPFRSLMSDPNIFTMLSHARLTAIDQNQPASTSHAVIEGLLRDQWKYEGILVTDDFSMGAITGTREGVGGSAVSALNAGVDLILVSYDPEQYYPLMDALLQADREGRLNANALARSDERLRRAAEVPAQ